MKKTYPITVAFATTVVVNAWASPAPPAPFTGPDLPPTVSIQSSGTANTAAPAVAWNTVSSRAIEITPPVHYVIKRSAD